MTADATRPEPDHRAFAHRRKRLSPLFQEYRRSRVGLVVEPALPGDSVAWPDRRAHHAEDVTVA
jgi:hypothetical protein